MLFFQETGFMLELVITSALYTAMLEKREKFYARFAVSLVVTLLIAWGWSTFLTTSEVWSVIARSLVFYALAYAVLFICVKLTWRQALFFAAGTVALQHASYSCAQIVMIGFPSFVEFVGKLHLTWLLYPALFLLFLGIGYLLFVRPMQGRLPGHIGGSFIVAAVGIMLCVTVFSSLFDFFISQTHIKNDAYFMVVLTRLVTCIFLLILLREITERETARRDSEFLQQLLSSQRQKLENDKETIDLINIKTHDLKKQIAVLSNRVPEEEIEDLTKLVGIYDSSIRTGNDALDVLLTNKALICEQRGIQFDRMIDGSSLSFMKAADIYSLFANAIDNAMDAVTRLDDPSDRYIRMKVTQNRGMVVIHVENPYSSAIKFKDGLPQTTKADKRYHGFGVKSMRLLTERYKGVMDMTAQDGIFSLNILLPIPRT